MEVRINKTVAIALTLIVIGVTLRLLPHAANFAPIGAIALFAGAVLPWRIALLLPLGAMIISDMVIGLHPTVAFTWGGFLLITIFGMWFRNMRNLVRIPIGAAGSALIFFIVSNFGVWLEGKLYVPTLQGLFESYLMALPFLKTSFLADLFYAAVLFGLFALVTVITKSKFKPNKVIVPCAPHNLYR